MKDFLYTLMRSLNTVEVRGRDNMDVLLGCINAIERMIVEIEKEESAPSPTINDEASAFNLSAEDSIPGPIINEVTDNV